MNALYSLTKKIAGFDFFFWLVMAKAAGANHVVFDKRNPSTTKWNIDCVNRRFDSILWPGPALLGMKASIGTSGETVKEYHQRELVKRVYAGLQIPRLQSVRPAGKERYTITLRNTQRAPTRNSREADWRTFGDEISARIIPDYDDEPIHLHERMALYAGAEMNFFTTNGPVILCFLGTAPAMSFDVQNSPPTKSGVPDGEQYPFLLNDRHRQIYEQDTLEVIRRHFYHWRDKGGWL